VLHGDRTIESRGETAPSPVRGVGTLTPGAGVVGLFPLASTGGEV
jgi:hypothetical protein